MDATKSLAQSFIWWCTGVRSYAVEAPQLRRPTQRACPALCSQEVYKPVAGPPRPPERLRPPRLAAEPRQQRLVCGCLVLRLRQSIVTKSGKPFLGTTGV